MRGLWAATLVAGVLVVPAPARAAACQAKGPSDFDGDGRADLVSGAPSAAVDGQARAGMVGVLYGNGNKAWTSLPGAERLDGFGAAVASADFNGDHCADLAVGAPGAGRRSGTDAQGAVQVYFGSPDGLKPGPKLTLSRPGSDRFGTALTAADLDGDGEAELAAGAPGRKGGGAVAVYGLRARGLKGSRVITSKIGRSKKRIASTDAFGAVLAAGDFNNDGRKELAVGLPGDGKRGWGSVTIVDVLRKKGRNISQSGALQGGPERSDRFGAALAAGDFNADGKDDLAVGVPGEAFTDPNLGWGEGAIHVLYGPGLRERGPMWNRLTKGVPGTVHRNDLFGAALSAGDLNGDRVADLAIGIPGANAVQILHGRKRKGLGTAKAKLVTTNLGRTSQFGFAVAVRRGTLIVGAPGANGFQGAVVQKGQTLGFDGKGLTGFLVD